MAISSLIVVHPSFDGVWPFAADHLRQVWLRQGPVEFIRLEPGDDRSLLQVMRDPSSCTRAALLGLDVTAEGLGQLLMLREAVAYGPHARPASDTARRALRERGIALYEQPTEGYWGQSVAEAALALTICALRHIPQMYRHMIHSQKVWEYEPRGGVGRPGERGQQYSDDPRFVAGTVEGKRVRVVGMGNIGSRYAEFTRMLGADVAAWDPVAPEPVFHRAGARHEARLPRLLRDADIFAPMLPLTDATRGVIHAGHIASLPRGCLVVLTTRAGIVDMPALRTRVLADELALAADVFDTEPLPLDDPLLGRHNVVHTPHLAGRTREANERWAEKLAEQFEPE